jgi:membrane-associated protease RseP (regulator of RpoE activity)
MDQQFPVTENLPSNPEQVDVIIRRIMRVEDTTLGSPNQNYAVRYRGKIYQEDTAAVYKQLEDTLKPFDFTPLFRWEGDRHVILLVKGVIHPKPSNPWINLMLFIFTIISVFAAGGLSGNEPLPTGFFPTLGAIIARGWPFTVALLAILAAHEFGHYLMGRKNKVAVSLPYFIPMPPPFGIFGTMGAFINMKSIPRNRRELLDIGIAGPLAGMAVAIPVLLLGLKLSSLGTVTASVPPAMGILEGNSLLYLFAKFTVFGKLLPSPVDYGNLSPFLYWVRYFFTSNPIPIGGIDVMLHPVAWAGWAGLFVTAVNLIPAGQLDGGHVINVLFGKVWSKRIFYAILITLAMMGFLWDGWWLWAGIIFLIGRTQAEPLDLITPLDAKRKWIGVLALIVFLITFTPIPLIFH